MEGVKYYFIITKAGYYYSTGSKHRRYGRFSERIERAEPMCKFHADENYPWMIDAKLSPRLVEANSKLYCAVCERKKK